MHCMHDSTLYSIQYDTDTPLLYCKRSNWSTFHVPRSKFCGRIVVQYMSTLTLLTTEVFIATLICSKNSGEILSARAFGGFNTIFLERFACNKKTFTCYFFGTMMLMIMITL